MPVRAVVLPATPLLVPGAGGTADPLAPVRDVVDAALAALLDDAPQGPLAVLAHRSGGSVRARALRPSLAGAGIGPRWAPVPLWDGAPQETAQVPASVALVRLAYALEARGATARLADVVVHEVPASLARRPDETARVASVLAAVAGVVVAGGGRPGGVDAAPEALAPGVAAVLAALTQPWEPEVSTVPFRLEHLPSEYRVTILRG